MLSFCFAEDIFTCSDGYIAKDYTSYLSTWYAKAPAATRNICWQLAKENVPEAEGMVWNYSNGFCRAIIESKYLLPWKETYPDAQGKVMSCLLTSKIPSN